MLALVLLAEPNVFRYVLRHVISFEAYRRGGNVRIEKVGGSLWEPVTLTNARWSFPFKHGSVLQLEAARVEAEFSWRELFAQNGGRWFRQLSLDGVQGKLELPPTSDSTEARDTKPVKREWLPIPARVEARGLNLTVSANSDSVRFQNGSFMLSELQQGAIHFEQIAVKQPWLTRTFRDVRGTTAVQDSHVVIADLALEKGVTVQTFSAEMGDLAAGQLNAEIQIAAFGGNIRAQAQTLPSEHRPGIEASGSFSQIGVAPLATFLGLSDAAGGTIKAGQFMFRGSPRNPSRAAASLRLEAVNFQWESRQWDSLVFGGTLVERRVQIPELELHQGHNHLSLNGEMALPTTHMAWWQSEFSFNIAAKIENLTELSALLLPEFKYAAGKMNIDGAVRGKNQQFNGALIVSGSDITWRSAPIEELHAALKITGNELQVANFELLNQDDFVRGRGVVNILGAKQYWGEIRGSVVDLASYSSLLQPPIVPEPLAGGAVINWSGEGSAKGHSGKFLARLEKLRTLGATGAFMHPVQAELEGVYAPGNIQFSRFALSDDQSAFAANVTVGNKALSLQDIRLTHGNELWLEGNATLPLDVWHAWPNTALPTLLTDGVPTKINLTAKNLQLKEASSLTGWKWPIEGIVDGSITAEGIVGALNTGGHLTLRNTRLPLGWNGETLTNVSGELSLEGQTLKIDQFTGQHPSGNYSITGQINFTNLRDTSLKLKVTSDAATLPAFRGLALPFGAPADKAVVYGTADRVDVSSRLDLQVEGPASAPAVTGSAQVLKVNIGGSPDTTQLWKARSLPTLPALFHFNTSPWQAWKFDVGIAAENAPVEPSAGVLSAKLQLRGTGASPFLAGELTIEKGQALAGSATLQIESATLRFRENTPSNPTFELHATGHLLGNEFTAVAFGPLSHPIREVSAIPPLTDELVRQGLTGGLHNAAPASENDVILSLAAPEALTGGAPSYEWAPVVIEEAPASAPVPSTPTPTASESAPSPAPANP